MNLKPFNKPVTSDPKYLLDVIEKNKYSGDGFYSKRCQEWFNKGLSGAKTLMMPSCTAALEAAALLIDIQEGDEVIMPSYTFVSTANAFALRGAKIVFVDIRPDTMNIDEDLIEPAITDKTKAIVAVHYAGVACEMDTIMAIAKRYGLKVIEDAAQGMMSTYNGKPLGTIGDLGCYSFHETKNYHCGEGGLLIINTPVYAERAEIIREKGTNRSKFLRGEVDKYTWVDIGSSYLPSEFQAAYLYGQLEQAEVINEDRLTSWQHYYNGLRELEETGLVTLPVVPSQCRHNAHMFYLKVADIETRQSLIDFLKQHEILSVFHYVPLHSSVAGKRYGILHGADRFTTQESEKLLRLPMYYGLSSEEIERIVELIKQFFKYA